MRLITDRTGTDTPGSATATALATASVSHASVLSSWVFGYRPVHRVSLPSETVPLQAFESITNTPAGVTATWSMLAELFGTARSCRMNQPSPDSGLRTAPVTCSPRAPFSTRAA